VREGRPWAAGQQRARRSLERVGREPTYGIHARKDANEEAAPDALTDGAPADAEFVKLTDAHVPALAPCDRVYRVVDQVPHQQLTIQTWAQGSL
jgi:hypothetical protein